MRKIGNLNEINMAEAGQMDKTDKTMKEKAKSSCRTFILFWWEWKQKLMTLISMWEFCFCTFFQHYTVNLSSLFLYAIKPNFIMVVHTCVALKYALFFPLFTVMAIYFKIEIANLKKTHNGLYQLRRALIIHAVIITE